MKTMPDSVCAGRKSSMGVLCHKQPEKGGGAKNKYIVRSFAGRFFRRPQNG